MTAGLLLEGRKKRSVDRFFKEIELMQTADIF